MQTHILACLLYISLTLAITTHAGGVKAFGAGGWSDRRVPNDQSGSGADSTQVIAKKNCSVRPRVWCGFPNGIY